MKTQLQKWGNSLAIRIPRDVLTRARLRQGDRLDLTVLRHGAIRVRRAGRKVTLAQLLRGVTSMNRHGETDWGRRRGREAW